MRFNLGGLNTIIIYRKRRKKDGTYLPYEDTIRVDSRRIVSYPSYIHPSAFIDRIRYYSYITWTDTHTRHNTHTAI